MWSRDWDLQREHTCCVRVRSCLLCVWLVERYWGNVGFFPCTVCVCWCGTVIWWLGENPGPRQFLLSHVHLGGWCTASSLNTKCLMIFWGISVTNTFTFLYLVLTTFYQKYLCNRFGFRTTNNLSTLKTAVCSLCSVFRHLSPFYCDTEAKLKHVDSQFQFETASQLYGGLFSGLMNR